MFHLNLRVLLNGNDATIRRSFGGKGKRFADCCVQHLETPNYYSRVNVILKESNMFQFTVKIHWNINRHAVEALAYYAFTFKWLASVCMKNIY